MINRRGLILGGSALVLAGAGLGYQRLQESSTAEYNAAVTSMRLALKKTP